MTNAQCWAHARREVFEAKDIEPDHAERALAHVAAVPIDTNHLERALRVIPQGRKNWMFGWTEVSARHIGIVQSLLVTSCLYEVNPYDYLVDVLQRVGHASRKAGRAADATRVEDPVRRRPAALRLVRPPVKSITPFGTAYRCVAIYREAGIQHLPNSYPRAGGTE